MESRHAIAACERFFALCDGNTAEEFFEANYSELRYTVVGYGFLKETYDRPDHSLATDRYFQYVFGAFYAMSRVFVTARFIRRFYKKMDEIKSRKQTGNLDAVKIALELGRGENSLQFSFVTKMLNLENDSLYPIYDSKVALMFGYKIPSGDHDKKAEQYRERYQLILETYRSLLNDNRTAALLNKFRQTFRCPELSDMRILDLIFWEMGKQEEKQAADRKKRSRVDAILDSDLNKGAKIRALMKMGLDRREVLDLEFVDPAYVYDLFREEQNRRQTKGVNVTPKDLCAVNWGSESLILYVRSEDLTDPDTCLALKMNFDTGTCGIDLLQRFLKFGPCEYLDPQNVKVQQKYRQKLAQMVPTENRDAILRSFAAEIEKWEQLKNKFDYEPKINQ